MVDVGCYVYERTVQKGECLVIAKFLVLGLVCMLVGLLWERLYADDLVVNSDEEMIRKLNV